MFEHFSHTCHGFSFLRVGVTFLTKKIDSENQDFRPYPSNTCQCYIWDILRSCMWPRFHKKEIKNIAFRLLSITFEHNLYYLVPFSLRYIINTHLIQYTCNTKSFSSVSDKCTLYMDATSKLNCLCFMAIKLTQRTFSCLSKNKICPSRS